MGNNDHDIISCRSKKIIMDDKWRMNEIIEVCKTIYSYKSILDCNYSQRKCSLGLNQPKITLNM